MPRWFVDAHCHLHEHFDLDVALDAALDNAANAVPVLMLADVPGESAFAWLDTQPGHRWRFESVEGGLSRRARRKSGGVVLLVCGRQVTSTEGLEVLALGCSDPFPPELSASVLIREVSLRGGIAILPWGFGKWIGKRGRVLERLLADEEAAPFYLGDNGGRFGAGLPRHFELARARGVLILPGSDPLPLENQERRVGSYGFLVPAGDLERPFESLKQILQQNDFKPVLNGSRVSFWAFLLQQVTMLLRKQLTRPRSRPSR